MTKETLLAPAKSHLLNVIRALLNQGWVIETTPIGGRLLRNGQKLLLKSPQIDLRLRLFVYKVTGSSRNRPVERRIEITSTYQKGLHRVRDYPDVVLGYEPDLNVFVGVDPERIGYGGPTGNASSFFDIEGLNISRSRGINVLQRRAVLFPKGIEYHAFIAPERLSEYFFNRQSIHTGTYAGDGEYSGRSKRISSVVPESPAKVAANGEILVLRGPLSSRRSVNRVLDEMTIAAFESGQIRRNEGPTKRISPEEFIRLNQIMAENGALGEELVVNAERRRLRRAGLLELATKVRWISQESVTEGYDIVSFETDGTERFIEVKSTVGQQKTFDISDNEWRTACHLGEKYYIYRVMSVRSKPSVIHLRNPQKLEQEGKLIKTASGWRVALG